MAQWGSNSKKSKPPDDFAVFSFLFFKICSSLFGRIQFNRFLWEVNWEEEKIPRMPSVFNLHAIIINHISLHLLEAWFLN